MKVGLFIFLMMLVSSIVARAEWKQTKVEEELTKNLSEKEFWSKVDGVIEKTCKAKRIGLHVIARAKDTHNSQFAPCDFIEKIDVPQNGDRVVYYNPDFATWSEISHSLKETSDLKLKITLIRDGKTLTEEAKLINGKLNLIIADQTWVVIKQGLTKFGSLENFAENCKKENWGNCFGGVPWSSTLYQTEDIMGIRDQDFKFMLVGSDLENNWFGTDYPTFKWESGFEYEKEFYAQVLFKKSDVLTDPQLSFVFIITGENRPNMVAASERQFVAGDLTSESCHKSFLEKHAKAKEKTCEAKRCRASYGYLKVMTTCIPNTAPVGVPYKAGLLVYNTVYMNSPYFQNEYVQFKNRLQNAKERKKLLDSIKEKAKLQEVL